jgi:uncharacterized membrane protein
MERMRSESKTSLISYVLGILGAFLIIVGLILFSVTIMKEAYGTGPPYSYIYFIYPYQGYGILISIIGLLMIICALTSWKKTGGIRIEA